MSTPDPLAELARRIHDAGRRGVIVVTGGGAGAIAQLVGTPGASRTVLEALVPYSAAALVELLKGKPEQFCSPGTARMMAMAAYRRACRLWEAGKTAEAPDGDPAPVLFGLGATASLASDRPKRGAHRIHLAAQTAATTWSRSIELAKDLRTRAAEEAIATRLALHLLAEVCELGVGPDQAVELAETERLECRRTDAPTAWRDLLAGRIRRTAERPDYADARGAPRGVFPGSFHPLHDGHRRMAAIAAERIGGRVDFELSIENVEKAPLDFEEMRERSFQFDGATRVWFTRAPLMVEKARLFPGTTIVCGLDTLLRVADPRFAGNSPENRDQEVAEITACDCRFLVFGRATGGTFQTLDDVEIPQALRRICDAVPESVFRADVSSTELRSRAGRAAK
jgi:hypothetical protein